MDIREKIISAESSGNLEKANQPNKTSSALGLGQFINATWLDMIKRHRQDLAKGKSDAEILELRKDGDLSKEMTAKYAAENEARLRRAGVPVTPTSTYLMHFAGPGGGVKLMKADPNTPVESILNNDAIQANPFLRGKTASWVIAWAEKKMENAAASAPNVAPRRSPWDGGSQPIPSLAQTQAVEPAFDATRWLARPASPNVLSPDAARRIAGAPTAAPIPFFDGAVRAQQALDTPLPPQGAAPWDLSDRFSNWRGLGSVFGPASSGGSGGFGQTGEGNGLGTSNERSVLFPLEALLAPDPGRGLNEWASSRRRTSALPVTQGASVGLPAQTSSAAGTNPSNSGRAPAGGLLDLIQDYMRYEGH